MKKKSITRILKSKKGRPLNLVKAIQAALDNSILLARWAQTRETRRNFGDALNPVLIRLLSGKKVFNANYVLNIVGKPVYSVIGSILDNSRDPHLVIWGSGFRHPTGFMNVKPKRVCAVRGPLTRARLIQQGIPCPEIFGDPALLMPLFYRPSRPKRRYLLGLVPHYVDKNDPRIQRFAFHPEVKIIDIESGIRNVITEINSCKFVASSSLHGLITADAYGIPTVWIQVSNRIAGQGFKFRDYLLSIGHRQVDPLMLTNTTSMEQIIDQCTKKDIDREFLFRLLETCPFMLPNVDSEYFQSRFEGVLDGKQN